MFNTRKDVELEKKLKELTESLALTRKVTQDVLRRLATLEETFQQAEKKLFWNYLERKRGLE